MTDAWSAFSACSGGCFAAVAALFGDRFRWMLCRHGCVGQVDALPPMMCCRLFTLMMLYLLAGFEM
jgi:hypothetical protein